MKHPTNHIFEQTPDTLAAWCDARGMPGFRAKQVLEWVYEKGIADPAQMSNLSKLDREKLGADMTFLSGETVRHQVATDGTQKLLIQWDDGEKPAEAGARRVALPVVSEQGGAVELDSSRQTECVMIPSREGGREEDSPLGGRGKQKRPGAEHRQTRRTPAKPGATQESGPSRHTACISSQVGCPVGCKFCASGLGGLDANLSAGRIVEQVWRLGRLPDVRRITNVVFMGMGEPLSNLGAVIPAIRTITSLWALGISARKVTVSTVGLPKAIEKLSEQLDLPVTLALSLHAPNDELRRQLIPWAEYTTIKELMASCQRWFDKTGREITLEYTLLRGVNDRPEHAEQLGSVAKTLRANINLIRYNEVKDLPFQRPMTEDVAEFQRLLRARHINTHIRASRGRDIAAACGQLRHETVG